MRVVVECLCHGGCDGCAITTYLDSGEEVACHVVVEDAEAERASFELMLRKVVAEAMKGDDR